MLHPGIKLNVFHVGTMTLPEELIKVVEINNGLELKIFDASRIAAADRWQVCMLARMDIPVNDAVKYLKDIDIVTFYTFKSAVGKHVRFEKKLVRNFIEGKVKDAVLEEMIASFLSDSIKYLSHPDFSRKYVLKQYNEYKKKKTWGT